MEFAQDDLTTWPYAERKYIVISRDDVVEEVRRAASKEADGSLAKSALVGAVRVVDSTNAVDYERENLAALLGVAAAGAVHGAATHLWRARRRAKAAELPIVIVPASLASNLKFPVGHPLQDVLYVGDPGVASSYYPAASFHHYLFDSKVAEAIRLLGGLGATEISIEHVQGFDTGAGVDFSISPPGGAGGEIGGGVELANKANSKAKFTMVLAPTKPAQIPDNLVWFSHEPLWQALANLRLEQDLREFLMDVKYSDDFGVNASLKAKVERSGLELGGKFTECRKTVWNLRATFAELSSLGRSSS